MEVSRKRVEAILDKEMIASLHIPLLREAIKLALKGGKRLRPMISLNIASALHCPYNIDKIAIVSELIHTASLIIDDLPCMDNDTIRRGNPTIHHKYGETRAQILTMFMFSKVYHLLHQGFKELHDAGLSDADHRRHIVFTTLSHNLGILGAPMGQYLDTCGNTLKTSKTSIPPTEEVWYRDLIHKKTSTLFEIAFILGYVAGGGDLKHLDPLRQCAHSFGIAFQISDDFQDTAKDATRPFCPNFINHLGKRRALEVFNECMNKCDILLDTIGIHTKWFKELQQLLRIRVRTR